MSSVFGPDEQRTIEAIAALLELMPRNPAEGDDVLAERMTAWGTMQGPEVRWDAIMHATLVMIEAQKGASIHFADLAVIGLTALHHYNEDRWGGM
jgi:hypothetical protein